LHTIEPDALGNAKAITHHVRATMALPLPPGLTPKEVAFLAEMELVTVVPRQRLDSIGLLSVGRPFSCFLLACALC
jgi:hypothetical protein